MSDAIDTEREETSETSTAVEFKPDVDRLLVYFITMAELGAETDVTLFIGGSRITGTVIGGKRYFDLLIEAVNSASTNISADVPRNMAQGLKGFRQRYETEPDFTTNNPTYIHMTNVGWTEGSTQVNAGSIIWRGKLSSVDAVIIGRSDRATNA